jgi:ribosomal protein L40E
MVLIGKVVWAGRPMGHVVGLGTDILETERLAARVAQLERPPTVRALRESSSSGPMKARSIEPKTPQTDGPEIVRVALCVDCGTKNRGDAYNCIKCGALLRSRRGSSTPE